MKRARLLEEDRPQSIRARFFQCYRERLHQILPRQIPEWVLADIVLYLHPLIHLTFPDQPSTIAIDLFGRTSYILFQQPNQEFKCSKLVSNHRPILSIPFQDVSVGTGVFVDCKDNFLYVNYPRSDFAHKASKKTLPLPGRAFAAFVDDSIVHVFCLIAQTSILWRRYQMSGDKIVELTQKVAGVPNNTYALVHCFLYANAECANSVAIWGLTTKCALCCLQWTIEQAPQWSTLLPVADCRFKTVTPTRTCFKAVLLDDQILEIYFWPPLVAYQQAKLIDSISYLQLQIINAPVFASSSVSSSPLDFLPLVPPCPVTFSALSFSPFVLFFDDYSFPIPHFWPTHKFDFADAVDLCAPHSLTAFN